MANPRHFKPGHLGFTLVEVLTTLGIIGIGLSLAVPGLAGLAGRDLGTDAANGLVATLHMARSEAITGNARVAICPSSNGRTCTNDAWEAGWIRFVDADGDFRTDAGESLRGSTPALVGVRVASDAFASGLAFTPAGRVVVPDPRLYGGEFTICSGGPVGVPAVLVLSGLGYPQIARQPADRPVSRCPIS